MKEMNLKIAEDLRSIGNSVNLLDKENQEMIKDDDKDKPMILKQFKILNQIDPFEAAQMIQSRAIDYVVNWSKRPPESHKDTVWNWQKIWAENQEMEKIILEES